MSRVMHQSRMSLGISRLERSPKCEHAMHAVSGFFVTTTQRKVGQKAVVNRMRKKLD